MKQVKLLATMSVALGLLFLYSCKSGEKKTEESTTDTTAQQEVPAPTPAPGPMNVMTIKHKVANYAKWKASYESHDSVREASGLHNYVIARGTDDSNMVMVVLKMDDAGKAKAFAASSGLKTRMTQAGVTGPTSIDYYTNIMNDTTNIQQTERLIVKHKVKDFDAWKKAFDDHKQTRMDSGLIDRVLGYTVDDNHNVAIVFAVTDEAKAKAFINSKDLKDKMKAGGVEGAPTFWFFRIADRY